MNRMMIISLCALIISMNSMGAEKNKIFITNNCSRSINVHARSLRPDMRDAFFFAKIKPRETVECVEALVINEIKIKGLEKEVYVPVLWGDSIYLRDEFPGDITIYAKK